MTDPQKRAALPWMIQEYLRQTPNKTHTTLDIAQALDADPFQVAQVLQTLQERGKIFRIKSHPRTNS